MRSLLLPALFVAAALVPVLVTACSSGDDGPDDSAESNVTSGLGNVGTSCVLAGQCKPGLACKPVVVAVGLPIHTNGLPAPAPTTSATTGGVIAVGVPIQAKTCQPATPGEAGAICHSDAECNSGLVCSGGGVAQSSSSGSSGTSGAHPVLGLPIHTNGLPQPTATTTSSGGPPPGALGLPIPPQQTCAPAGSSSGGTSGAVGLPIPAHS